MQSCVRIAVALIACGLFPVLAAAESKLDTAKIEQLTGAKGAMSEKEAVFKVSLPPHPLH